MKIYRFEKDSDERINAIKDKKIYLSAPSEFNDLEDCRLNNIFYPETDSIHLEKIKFYIDLIYNEVDKNQLPFSEEIFFQLKRFLLNPGEDLESSLLRNDIVAYVRAYLKSTVGACCFFSGEPIHPLMWAHYADNHTGFCAEYEINSIEHPFYRVNYTTEYPTPSIYELLFCPEENFNRILTTKAHEWSYEKEIRALFLNKFDPKTSHTGVLENLPSGIKLTKIIKGAKFKQKSSTNLESLGVNVASYIKYFVAHNKKQATAFN